ncbi:DUF3467 domain-containing protein (plasmid) [Pseudohalocynthiibacter aestuariivivens]|nr:DUF3467 domain-containing protein [Pseudohalocynthiibacter aestuariivivens]QIE48245.1 DUF3467 domain-containing protein [Pseudohalocynthiibacter aestuariivivens]
MTQKNGEKSTKTKPAKAAKPAPTPEPEPAAPERRVKLDTSRMKSSYCNVCNATSTREEVVINFGLNQSWDRSDGDLEIEIAHRVILSPHAAGKLREVLNELIDEYEGRYGSLKD